MSSRCSLQTPSPVSPSDNLSRTPAGTISPDNAPVESSQNLNMNFGQKKKKKSHSSASISLLRLRFITNLATAAAIAVASKAQPGLPSQIRCLSLT